MSNVKAKYWVAVCYPENMLDNWEDAIGDLVEVPYAYCIHDGDRDKADEARKKHVHIILAYPNTTTYKHALTTYQRLSAPGRSCCNTCEQIINIRSKYDYLIHDTEASRKAGKYLYDKKDRITGNNFDIGLYEQLSLEEKEEMADELAQMILQNGITNYADFYYVVSTEYEKKYRNICRSYSGHFDRLIKGMYHKALSAKEKVCD